MEVISKITELESFIPKMDLFNTKVSKASVGWHIEHSLKVINVICSDLRNSNPAEFTSSFNWQKTYVMTFKSFPRGIGKAPRVTRPVKESNIENIQDQLSKARYLIDQLKDLNENAYFPHPVFGNLNLKPAIKFLGIHTNHHLKIIKDILK
jgi:hypothetical protein